MAYTRWPRHHTTYKNNVILLEKVETVFSRFSIYKKIMARQIQAILNDNMLPAENTQRRTEQDLLIDYITFRMSV